MIIISSLFLPIERVSSFIILIIQKEEKRRERREKRSERGVRWVERRWLVEAKRDERRRKIRTRLIHSTQTFPKPIISSFFLLSSSSSSSSSTISTSTDIATFTQ
jgi:hypothetical protein